MSQLKLDLRVGDFVSFDDGRVKVTLLEKSGRRARLDVAMADNVKVRTSNSEHTAAIAEIGAAKPVMKGGK